MITQATDTDIAALAEMASHIWHNSTPDELRAAFAEIIGAEDAICYIHYCDEMPVGFAQCSLRRDYVEGTSSSPVGYLEGIFVQEEYRNRGYAGVLLAACEAWAQRKGCTEFASDCELDNTDSYRFHQAMGFVEANRVICFTKPIGKTEERR